MTYIRVCFFAVLSLFWSWTATSLCHCLEQMQLNLTWICEKRELLSKKIWYFGSCTKLSPDSDLHDQSPTLENI